MKEKYYNIHNIIKFKIVTEDTFEWKFRNIYKAYKNFENKKEEDLDFIIYLGNFNPSNENCSIIDYNYYFKKDYIYIKKGSYKFTKWKFEISGFDDNNLKAYISCNTPGYLWISGFIIDFLILYKINEKGYSIVHASAISKNGMGTLFTARGGGGKTTIALHFMEKGYNILGDNFVILYKGEVLSYFSPLNIFSYNLANVIKKNMTNKDEFRLLFKKIIYSITGGYIKIFTTFNPKKLFKDLVVDKTYLNSIFLILPKDSFKLSKIRREDLIEQLLLNQKLDTLLFMQYFLEYSYSYPESKLSKIWDDYKNNLNNNLPKNLDIYKIEVPKRYDQPIFDEIESFISK